MDGRSANVPVFVQPDSEQCCLLGMNAISSLGIHVVRSTGEALLPASQDEPLVATVNLLSSITIPSQSGHIVKAQLFQSNAGMGDLLFEPCHNLLAPLGVSAQESVLSRCDDHTVLVPMENHQGVTVHLDPGTQLGVVKSVQVERDMRLVDQLGLSDSRPLDPPQTSSGTAHVQAVKATPERCMKLSAALILPAMELARDEVPMLEALVCKFANVFAVDDSELGSTSLVRHMINTGDHMPIKQQPYHTPVVRRQALAKMIGDMQEQGVVRPSSSPWASPVILVHKKDGSLHFCVNYHRLNSITVKDVYPLPRVDNILDALGGAKYFSSLDLASGYWQDMLSDDSSLKSDFTTEIG